MTDVRGTLWALAVTCVALAVGCNGAHAQVTFLSDANDRTFPGEEPVCVHDSGNAFSSGANDCTDAGGHSQITGVRVGDSANSITIDTVGPNKVGVLFIGTGTHQTTLDGSNGNVNVGGTLNIHGGFSVDPLNNNIDFGGNVIHGIGTPLSGTDAANKAYVDTAVAHATNGGDRTFDTVTVNGVTQTASLSVVHDASVGGKLTVTDVTTMNGGAVVKNGLTVSGGTTIDSLTVTGNSSVQGKQTVTGQSFLNGGATVSNNFTATPGTTVDMGANRVQNVGAPVLGTDAANKAYVDAGLSDVNHRIDKAFEGTAIALSLATPIFQPGQKFVVQGGWGGFEGTNAFGFTAAGLLARDVFGPGSTVTVSGGVGAGTENGTVAGRAAVSVGW